MRCIAVPDPLLAGDPHYRNADLVLDALTGLNEETMRSLGWVEWPHSTAGDAPGNPFRP
jgi:hypothetical protein